MRPSIVILSSRFPFPLRKGDKLRLYQQLKVLSEHFDIHLICINEDHPANTSFDAVRLYCKSISVHIIPENSRKNNLLLHALSSMPLQVRYFYDRFIKDKIQEEIRHIGPDFIHVHLIRMAPYLIDLHMDIPISIDYMDSLVLNDLADQYLNKGLKRFWKSRERRLIRKLEYDSLSLFDHHFIISERDKKAFPNKDNIEIKLLSNGVDTQYFSKKDSSGDRRYDIIFCGNLSYAPNVEAANFIIDQLVPNLAEYQFCIAGASLPRSLKIREQPRLTIKGDLEDIRNVYGEGVVMIIPIFHGSGQQNKVLEAMACGVPCITTSFVNESIGAMPGKEVLIADDAESFILSAKVLLSHPEKRDELSKAARLFVERKFDWSVNTAILVNTIKGAINE